MSSGGGHLLPTQGYCHVGWSVMLELGFGNLRKARLNIAQHELHGMVQLLMLYASQAYLTLHKWLDVVAACRSPWWRFKAGS